MADDEDFTEVADGEDEYANDDYFSAPAAAPARALHVHAGVSDELRFYRLNI